MSKHGPASSEGPRPLIIGWDTGRRLGRGGQGEVWGVSRAKGAGLEHRALKVLSLVDHDAEVANEWLRLFGEERVATQHVRHPSVLTYFEGGHLENGYLEPTRGVPASAPYVLMEYLEGADLKSHFESLAPMSARRDPEGSALPPKAPTAGVYEGPSRTEVLRILRHVTLLGTQLGRALKTLHDANIVHRDVSPQNILVLSDPQHVKFPRPVLLDFGIAHFEPEPTVKPSPDPLCEDRANRKLLCSRLARRYPSMGGRGCNQFEPPRRSRSRSRCSRTSHSSGRGSPRRTEVGSAPDVLAGDRYGARRRELIDRWARTCGAATRRRP